MLPVILLSLAWVYKQLICHFALHKPLCCIWLHNNHNCGTWHQCMSLVSCNLTCTYCLVHIRMQLLCFLFEGTLDQFISCRGLHTKNFVWVFDGSTSSANSMCTSMSPFRHRSTSSQLCHCKVLSTGQMPAPLTTTSCRVFSTLTLILAMTNYQAAHLNDMSLLWLGLCASCLAVHGMLACKAKCPNIRTPGQVQTDNTNSNQSDDCRLSTHPIRLR